MINIKKTLLLTALPLALAGFVLSANLNAEEDNTISDDASYEVTIPANVSFDSTTKTNKMTVSGSVNKSHDLNISISSENGFKLKQDDFSIDYTLKDGDTVVKSGDSWSFPEGKDYSKYEVDSTFSKELTLSTDGGYKAGDYTDKLIFTLTDNKCYHLGVNPKNTSLTIKDVSYEVYVNNTLVTPIGGSDTFSKNIPKGSTYEVKNITVKNDNYVYAGADGDLSGTLSEDKYVWLNFADTTNTVTFDLNAEDATCDTTSKKVAKSYAYGTLPTPTREGYIFDGWYTDATDGEVVTKDSIFNEDSDITLYAHWHEYSYKLIKGEDLDSKIRFKATSVVFTDEKAPENTTVQDLSYIGDGSVVGWWEDTTYTISTQVSGKKVIFNENSGKMFYLCKNLTSIEFTNVDTSNVTDMSGMFAYSAITSLDLSSFDTSNVTAMTVMFNGTNLTDLDLSSFDTSKVTTMCWMFGDCKSLTSLNLTSFNTEKVTDLTEMFMNCSSLTSLDLSSFNTSSVTKVGSMFKNASNLETLFVSDKFKLSENVTENKPMFEGCSKLPNYDSDNPVVDKTMAKSVSSGGYLYVNAKTVTFDAKGGEFSDGSVTSKLIEKGQKYGALPTVTKDGQDSVGWYTDAVRGEVVTEESVFNSDDDITLYAHWNGNSYKLMSGSDFYSKLSTTDSSVTSLVFTDTVAPDTATIVDLTEAQDESVGGWVENATWYISTQSTGKKVIFNKDSSYMFNKKYADGDQYQFTSITFGNNVDTSQVEDMAGMFHNCQEIKDLDLSGFDTSNVISMSGMFYQCAKLKNLNISSFNTSKVTNMSSMFGYVDCTSLDLTNFDTSQITNMRAMFSNCWNLETLDLSSFDTTNVTNTDFMFYTCRNLTNVYVRTQTDLEKLSAASNTPSTITFTIKDSNF